MSFKFRLINSTASIGFGIVGSATAFPLEFVVPEPPSMLTDPELQSHCDKKCAELGIRNVPVRNSITLRSLSGIGAFQASSRKIFIAPPSMHPIPMEIRKAIINHELGHVFHKHQLQENAVNAVLGALCFFKKTRLSGLIGILLKKITSAPRSRFQERQADAVCYRLSTPEQRSSLISFMEKLESLEPKPKSELEKTLFFFTKNHPPMKKRIDFFNQKSS